MIHQKIERVEFLPFGALSIVDSCDNLFYIATKELVGLRCFYIGAVVETCVSDYDHLSCTLLVRDGAGVSHELGQCVMYYPDLYCEASPAEIDSDYALTLNSVLHVQVTLSGSGVLNGLSIVGLFR